MSRPSLLICATEISGDARGARLARELLRIGPPLRLYGLGGDRMRRAGVDVRIDITDRGTIGWFDHWRDVPCYLSALRFWTREIHATRPVAAIVVDAPGISFPFARVARSAGVPVAYFVTPQTWLWNPRAAVDRLRSHADVVVPTLAAEADLYARAGLPVVFEGHPALDDLVETYGAPCGRHAGGDRMTTIGLVPGSRRHAVRRLLPVMLAAVQRIGVRVKELRVVISAASPALREEAGRRVRAAAAAGLTSRPALLEQDLPAVLRASDIVLASTGGNLLDAAFAGTPAVACYRVDGATHAIARHVMRLHRRVPSFALPNLIAGRTVVPELLQADVTPAALAEAAVRLLTDEAARREMLEGYAKVRSALGEPGVNARIAARLLSELRIEN